MPITFETEWAPADGIRSPELAATWASLLIRIDDFVITRVVDRRAQTVRDRVYLPLYPLAESLASNWWFLLHEVGNPVRNDDAFRRRHVLASARDGYAFPRIEAVSSGPQTMLSWTSDSLDWAKLEYTATGQIGVETEQFRASCADLVDRVTRRLDACGIEGTFLQEEWQSIQAANPDETMFCKSAAGLGWDPYAVRDSEREAVLRLDKLLDKAIFEEAIAVLDATCLDAEATALAEAFKPANGTCLPLEYFRAACGRPVALDQHSSPWSAGYALARDARQHLGLNGEPIPTVEALGEALREQSGLVAAATEPRDMGVTDLVNGVVARDTEGLPFFAVGQGPLRNRRFHFCRGLAEMLTSPDSSALLTKAQSFRQQMTRAFAAEFLAPAAALRTRVDRSVVGHDDVDDLADYFGVSPFVVEHQLQNHQIAKIQ